MTNVPPKISFNTSRSPFFDRKAEEASVQVADVEPRPDVKVSFDDTNLMYETAEAAPVADVPSVDVADEFAVDTSDADADAVSGSAAASVAASSQPHWKATQPQVEKAAQSDPEWRTAMEPNPFREPARAAPGFAATGLMAAQQGSFFQRQASVLTATSVVFAVFLLGVTAAVLWLTDRDAPQRAQGATPDAQEVATRSVTPDMTQVATLPAGAVQPATNSGALAQAVLAGLTPDAQQQARSAMEARQIEAFDVLNTQKLRMLREAVLADMFDVITVEDNGAKHVQIHTVNAEMNSSFADAILIDAVKRGQIEMGLALRTPDGGVDVTTMVFNRVQTSLFADETPESVQAARNMSRKVFAASVARTEEVSGARVYTVQPGDSLAYISLQFFGKPSEYKRILEANRDTLHSPDQIQIGQRIVIPS